MKKLKLCGVICIFVMILIKPEAAAVSAQRAMAAWYTGVAPALFPFLVLMPLLTGKEACAAYEALFSKWMRPLFRLPGAAAPAVVAGMISGSPGGALTLQRVAANSELTAGEVRRIALALGGVSPAYLIMGVGQGLCGSAELGLKLAGIQAGIQLLLLFLLPNPEGKEESSDYKRRDARNPIGTAVESILVICGYMVIFSVIAGVSSEFVGKRIGAGLLLTMDLPSGLSNLSEMQISGKLVVMGAAIGFGGLCIMSQNMDVIRKMGVRWQEYLCVRIVSGSLFAAACLPLGWINRRTMLDLNEITGTTYAFSLFAVGIIAIPVLILISKNIFLNKTKNPKIGL